MFEKKCDLKPSRFQPILPGMKIESISVGAFSVNCLLLHGTDRQVLVVDPGADAKKIAHHLESRQQVVAGWLLTHGHADHLSALATLVQRFEAPVYMHAADQSWAFSPVNQIPPYYAVPIKPPVDIHPIGNGETIQAGGLEVEIIETPGHTPGCVCYYLAAAKTLVTGDTLFAGSAGRTDLPGGDMTKLTQSLGRLAKLPDNCTIFPGHGESSTIGREKRTNPFMQNTLTEI